MPQDLIRIRFWDLAGTGPKETKEAKENYDGEQACTASVLPIPMHSPARIYFSLGRIISIFFS